MFKQYHLQVDKLGLCLPRELYNLCSVGLQKRLFKWFALLKASQSMVSIASPQSSFKELHCNEVQHLC